MNCSSFAGIFSTMVLTHTIEYLDLQIVNKAIVLVLMPHIEKIGCYRTNIQKSYHTQIFIGTNAITIIGKDQTYIKNTSIVYDFFHSSVLISIVSIYFFDSLTLSEDHQLRTHRQT